MTADIYSLIVRVDSTQVNRASGDLDLLQRNARQTESALSSAGSAAKILGTALGGLSLGVIAKDILQVNMQFEVLRTSLETVTGSAKNANVAFESIQKFAATTPYSVKEVTDSFIKMKALGLAPTEKALTSFGNTASAMGKSLNQMIEAVADASTGEFERLKEFGIKSSKEGEKIKFTFRGVETTVRDSATEITKYLEQIGNVQFAGGMERQAKTMKGTLSSLADAWDNFQDHIISDAAQNSIARWVNNATNMLVRFDNWINGAFTKQGKLAELRAQQASSLEKIMASEKNGIVGRAVDAVGEAVWGYSIENEKKKLAAIGSQMESIKKEIESDKKISEEITKAAPVTEKKEEVKAKKTRGASSAQKELNDQLREQQRIIESTAAGSLMSDVESLNKAYATGLMPTSEYNLRMQSLADSYNNAVYGAKDLKDAQKELNEALAGSARGQFESGYSSLQKSKEFMTAKEYESKQSQLLDSYLSSTGNAPKEASKDFESFNSEIAKATESFNELGNSGKMAFDGILGGISAVAGAVTSFGEEMTKLNDNFANASKSYSDFMLKEGTTFEEREKATASYYKMKNAYDSASFKAEISGARQIAGATSKLFGEKSAARKAFHAVEMGLSVIEMAMAAKKMIVDVAAGAANMFAQGGFAGFAGVAAMTAVMAGLGFAMSGGGGKTVDNTIPATKATGTVLGDINATSNSVQKIVDTLNEIHAQEFPELQAISDGFRGLDNSMVKLNQIIMQSTANFTNTQSIGVPSSPTGAKPISPIGGVGLNAASIAGGAALGAMTGTSMLGSAIGAATGVTGGAVAGATGVAVGAGAGATGAMVGGAILGLAGGLLVAGLAYGLGKLLGIGKTKITQLGEGIVINANSLLTDGMLSAVDAQTWRKDEFKTKGWLGSKKKIVETFGVLSGEVYESIAATVGNITNVSLTLANELNALDALGYKFEQSGSMPFLKIDWYKEKLKGEDVSKLMNDQLNAYFDRIAENLFKTVLGEFQKIGEGMLQTVSRVTLEMKVVQGAYRKLGSDVGEASLGLAGFSDRLVQLYNSSADANDGLKNFMETMNDIYNLTTNEGKKAQYSIDETKKALTGDLFKQVTGETFDVTKLFDTEYVSEQYLKLVNATSELAKKASDAETKVKEMSNAVQDAWNPTPTTKPDEAAQGFIKSHSADWQRVTGVSNIQDATWETVRKAGFEDFFKNATNAVIISFRDTFLNAKSEIQASGIAAGGLTITPEQQKANLAAAQSESEAAAALAKNSQSLVYVLEPFINKSVPKLNNLVDAYLKSTMSAEKWLGVERSRIIKKEYANITENMRDYAEYNDITNAMIKQGFEGLTDASEVSAESMQRFVWTLEDSAKTFDKLSNSGKYLLDFSRGIKQWVENLRATQLGSPSTQIESARRAFNEQLNLAKFAPDAETKRGALSGITGYADTFINAIKSFYGSSEEGQKQLQNVVDEVSNLEKGLSIQELQLGALQDIKDAIMDSAITIPKGISEESAKIYESLLSKAQIAGSEYKSLPTVENALKFDAFAKVVMTIDRQSQSQDAKFVDELIKSVIGEKGISAAIDVVINNATLTGSQKESVLNNLTAEFNKALEGFNGLEKVASEITRVNELWNGIKLDSTPVNNAGIAVKGLTNDLVDLNGEYDVVITQATGAAKKVVDFGKLNERAKVGLDGVAGVVADLKQIETSANAARNAMNALAQADAYARNVAIENAQIAKNAAVIAATNADIKNTPAIAPSGLSVSNLAASNATVGSSLISAGFSGTIQLPASTSLSTEVLGGGASRGQSVKKSYFADGGAFTNGVVSKPTAFNMGLMGESGSEAIMPLVNIGGSLGVRAVNDSNVDTAKTIEELKTIVRQQDAMIRVMQDGFSKLQAENKEQNENLNNLASSVRLQARG